MDQKESRGAAQMDWEPLAFLMKSFSTIQRTGVGGLKKNQMRALFGFIWSVLLKCSDCTSPENTQTHCLKSAWAQWVTDAACPASEWKCSTFRATENYRPAAWDRQPGAGWRAFHFLLSLPTQTRTHVHTEPWAHSPGGALPALSDPEQVFITWSWLLVSALCCFTKPQTFSAWDQSGRLY